MFPLIQNDQDKIGQRHVRDQQTGPFGLNRPPPLKDAYYGHNNNNNNNAYYEYNNNNAAYTFSPTTFDENAAIKTATGVWNYMLGVTICLVLWVFSLMLPRGVRKQFFGAYPRRYTKRRYDPTELEEFSTNLSTMDSVNESFLAEVERRRMLNDNMSQQSSALPSNYTPAATTTPNQKALSTISDSDTGSLYLRPLPRSARKYLNNTSRASTTSTSTPSFMRASPSLGMPTPSPGHPAIPRLPSAKILNETMQRLKTRGIRLVAHGVASDSKRVWIKFEEDTTSLSWQTEFARKVPNQLGEISIVMMRGALHRIALPNILYVDVGKKTNALTKPENRDVPDSVCFSLLTQNGSLDLQANSRLERDALVSCFSMVLDEVHTQDWRSLYAESPETSAVQSVCTGSDLNQVEF
jgi:hypothetical protein